MSLSGQPCGGGDAGLREHLRAVGGRQLAGRHVEHDRFALAARREAEHIPREADLAVADAHEALQIDDHFARPAVRIGDHVDCAADDLAAAACHFAVEQRVKLVAVERARRDDRRRCRRCGGRHFRVLRRFRMRGLAARSALRIGFLRLDGGRRRRQRQRLAGRFLDRLDERLADRRRRMLLGQQPAAGQQRGGDKDQEGCRGRRRHVEGWTRKTAAHRNSLHGSGQARVPAGDGRRVRAAHHVRGECNVSRLNGRRKDAIESVAGAARGRRRGGPAGCRPARLASWEARRGVRRAQERVRQESDSSPTSTSVNSALDSSHRRTDSRCASVAEPRGSPEIR